MDGAPRPVAIVATRAEAEGVAKLLRDHDVPATIVDDDDDPSQQPRVHPHGSRVLVTPEDHGRALRVMHDARFGRR